VSKIPLLPKDAEFVPVIECLSGMDKRKYKSMKKILRKRLKEEK